MKPGVILGFGEIMGRVSMPGFLRFGQAMPGRVDVDFAGAEANTLGFLATLGHDARLVTALPANEIGDACVAALRHRGVGTSAILRTDVGRLGLYFLEKGAGQRPGNVVYDRSGSSVALTPGEAYHWDRLLEGAAWLHLSGITPALSQVAAGDESARAGMRQRFLVSPAAWFGASALAARSHGFERMGYLQADLEAPRHLSVYLPEDRPGSLRALLAVFERLGVNMASIHSSRTPEGELHFRIGLDRLPVPMAQLRAEVEGAGIGRVLEARDDA